MTEDDHQSPAVRVGLQKRSMRRALPLRLLIPNLLTVLALAAGLTAIRFSIEGRFEMAATLILIAAVLDGLDGRVARYMQGATPIGAEMDSLADIVNFGVAPALMVYFWALQDSGNLGWIAALIFTVCCLLRLARFNVMSRDGDVAEDERRFFVGVPSPAAGGLALFPMFLYLAGFEPVAGWDAAIAIHLIVIGFLMVSRFPTFSFKTILVPREHIVFVMIGTILTIAIILSYPWQCMVLIDLAYLVSLAISWRAKRTAKANVLS